MGGITGEAIAGSSKTFGFFYSPLGKANLIITGVFLIVLIFLGITESIEQKSVYPLLEKTVFKVVGADALLGHSIDVLESSPRPSFVRFFSKQGMEWLWFWTKFVFEVVSAFWFIYFFCWMIYTFWEMSNNSLIFRNIFYTIVTFLLITWFVGLVLYNMSLSGYCLPDDKMENFNMQMANSYPLNGVIKFVTHWINGDLIRRVGNWTETSLGKAVTGIPDGQETNVSLNVSNNLNLSNVSGGI